MIKEAIHDLIAGSDLEGDVAQRVMNQIMSGEATDAQIGAFLVALRIKGETVDEIAGCARVMREKATPILTEREPVIDTCGTGGDGAGTFNISTTVAFVVAGAGLCVAKHGNRAVSSKSGSADVLKALGVNIEASPTKVVESLNQVGLGFLFAVTLHGAMRHAIGPRREIATRTIFNALGPLTNPAGARRQLIGVYAPEMTDKLAAVLRQLGSECAFVVHGSDGLDEITLSGSTRISELRNGNIDQMEICPEDFGFRSVTAEALRGGEPMENADILIEVLQGHAGPRRDVVLLNAGAALVVGGIADDIAMGIELAKETISSGRPLQILDELRRISNS